MGDPELPLHALHVRMLVSTITNIDDAIEESKSLTSYDLKPSLGFTGKLFIAKPNVSPPKWLEFVQTGAAKTLEELGNRSNAAVLVIKRKEKIFAFTFGHGRHFLKEENVVHNFGIRTALNALRPDSIRSVDSFSLEDQTVHKRAQASKASSIGVFGLDVGRDILRAVTGKPNLNIPFTNISGNESSLAFSVRTDFPGLGEICDLLTKLYRQKTYKDNFAWVDNVRRETNPATQDKLNELLVEELKQDSPNAYLAPPEIVDWENFDCFKITGGRKNTYSDLSLEEYLSCHSKDDISIDTLRAHKASFFSDPSQAPEMQWSIFKCIIFEATLAGKRFYLNGGEWFEIEKSFFKGIQSVVSSIAVTNLMLPGILSDANGKLEHEGDYNTRVCNIIKTMALMDKRLVRCNLATSDMEVCDLLTHDKKLIHVKHKKGGSSSLSHLFFQARNSAEALLSDEKFRNESRKILKDLKPSWESRIPVGQPKPADFEIVMAFLGTKKLNPASELPFFSQLSLARTHSTLASRGFAVTIIGILRS